VSQRTDATAKKVFKLGCLPVLGLVVLLIILGSALDGGDGGTEDAKPLKYSVVEQDDSGNKRNVVVEVDTTAHLRKVFDAVADSLSDEAGYYIMINCSTGGTKDVDNRLANGQKAIGRMGAVTTGLEPGDTEFSTNDDRTCPVDPADQAKEKEDQEAAAKAAGIPPRPTGADRQSLLDALAEASPDVVKYEDKAVDAARNQCSAINGEGVRRIDWLASQRFTYKDVITTEEQGAKINAALKKSGFCEV
jgi:hypothetical protein